MTKRPTSDLIDLELARAARPVVPPPNGLPEVKRVGLGYEAKFLPDVTVTLSHLHESRDQIDAEMRIDSPSAGTVKGILYWGRFNLMAAQTRNSIAKSLSERVDADWRQYLELICLETVRLHREGEPAIQTEDRPATPMEYTLNPILPMGLPTSLWGIKGIGKSTLAAAIAVSVETGVEIIPGWRPKYFPTLMCDWEGDRDSWEQRCNAIARGAGLEPPRMWYRQMRRRLSDEIDYLAKLIADHDIALVIVDSVGLAFGTAREGGDPSEPILRAFQSMREIGSVSWLLIDHMSKAEGRTGDGSSPYGSEYKGNLIRQGFLLEGDPESESENQEVLLKHKKANYSRPLRPQGLIFKRPDSQRITVHLSDHLESTKLSERMSVPQRLVRLLEGGAQAVDYCREDLGLKPSHFRITLKRCLDSGMVIKLKDGRLALPTDKWYQQ